MFGQKFSLYKCSLGVVAEHVRPGLQSRIYLLSLHEAPTQGCIVGIQMWGDFNQSIAKEPICLAS
jgi:hypothetical protein